MSSIVLVVKAALDSTRRRPHIFVTISENFVVRQASEDCKGASMSGPDSAIHLPSSSQVDLKVVVGSDSDTDLDVMWVVYLTTSQELEQNFGVWN